MSSPIDYAPAIPWYRRRRTRRVTFFFITIIIVAVAVWKFSPLVYRRLSLLYWQSRCLNYTAPPPPTTAPFPVADRAAPPEFDEFLARFPPHAFNTAPGYVIPGFSHVYLHRRQSAAGERLVMAELNYDPIRGGSLTPIHQSLIVTVITPATLWSDPVIHASCFFPVDAPNTSDVGHLFPGCVCEKALPAESDPADNASFTLPLFLYDIVELTDPPTVPPLHLHTFRFRLNPAGDAMELDSVIPPLPPFDPPRPDWFTTKP